jgi:hypothetical protein
MDTTLEASEGEVSVRGAMSAFSGLALLCVLVAALAASTFIASGEGAGTPDVSASPSRDFGGNEAIPSISFYLLETEAQFEGTTEIVELAATQVGATPLQNYPVVTLVAGTPDDEAVAYARIIEHVRSSNAEPRSINIVDLRGQKPK